MSFPTVSSPQLSPFLNEYDSPVFTDDQGNILPLLAVVQPDSSGVTGLISTNVTKVPNSQVTSKRQAPIVGASKLPVVALVQVNPTTGALEPFAADAGSVALAGDVTGPSGANTVAMVGGSTAANVHAAELAANAATDANTASTIVKRDGSGNFSAGTITAGLAGNATSATSAGTAAVVSGKFQSTVQTGTGSSQSIPHGLGVVPSLVLVVAYNTTDAGIVAAGYSIVEGVHTSTNVLVTATTNLQYKVIAFA